METYVGAAPDWPTIPGYRIVGVISQTQMSTVYLAEDLAVPRRVALKVPNPRWAELGFRERFQREVATAAALEHPNVIPVYTTGEHESLPYLVMRYIDGPDLVALVKDGGPLDLATTRYVIGRVAAALDAAHAAGFVHRDVKPGNVMLDSHRHVYLGDFGIARDEAGGSLTTTGQFIGTRHYAAPEQFEDGPVDGRADCYALGGVLYYCLTGRPPFTAGADGLAMRAGYPPRVTDHRPDLPAALDAVLATALAADPARRYVTCGALANAVGLVAERTTAPPPLVPAPPPLPTRPVRRRRRRWPVVAGVGAAVVGLVAAALVAIRPWEGAARLPQDLLARVPAGLRDGCARTDAATAGYASATDALTCRDSSGREAVIGLFAGQAGMDAAYGTAVRDSGVARGTGDCTITPDAEHRYPPVDTPAGRVVCFSKDATTTFVWTDDQARTVARTSSRETDDLALQQSWATWVRIPAYPTAGEQALLDLVNEPACKRVPAGDLDRFRDVVVGVECDPSDDGATTVSYYRFADVDGVKRSYDSHVSAARVPPGVFCADDPPPAGFRGSKRYDLRSVEIGGLLCHPGAGAEIVLEWSVEPLLLLGHAVGTNAKDLVRWWNDHYAPPPLQTKIAEGVNAHASPAFPSPAERALLDHIPPASRVNCMRPSANQVKVNVPHAKVTGLVCGPTRGATIVFYYQFPDQRSMNANYALAGAAGPACTTNPPNFTGESSYSNGGATGRLACAVNLGDRRFATWTNNRLNIQTLAIGIQDPQVLIDWWRTEAGPV